MGPPHTRQVEPTSGLAGRFGVIETRLLPAAPVQRSITVPHAEAGSPLPARRGAAPPRASAKAAPTV
ncbi:hypothetical protein GCM10023235_13950 [Kitasatospora terrestris]|uniref:Uncharacterized protein n=1 Tax=Kitasatospora terrestris TaxID=258051 RepID=A0ABP9DH19_9ACTN